MRKLIDIHRPLSQLTITCCRLRDVAKKIGIKGDFSSRFSDSIYAHLLAKKPPQNQYAPESQTRFFRMHKLRRTMIAASILILISGLGLSAANFVDGLTAIQDTQGMKRQASFYQVRYDRAPPLGLPKTPTDTRVMQRVVEATQELKLFKTSPLDLMSVLSRGMDVFPEIELSEVNWSANTQISNSEDAQVSNNGSVTSTDSNTVTLQQQAIIQAHINPFDGDFRKALETVRRFAEHLRQLPEVKEVDVESLPLDIGPEASLSGDVEGLSETSKAQFSLRMELKALGGPGESS